MKKMLLAATVGIVFGFIATHYLLVGSYLNLFVWVVAAMVLGYMANSKRQGAYIGAAFGFCLTMAFMISGYTGQQAVVTRLLPFAIIALVGAACGLTWSVIGRYARQFVDKKK